MAEAVSSRPGSPIPNYIVHLDAVRALAAFLVLAGHARMLLFGDHTQQASASTDTASEARILGLGHHAVIVFFVLSGFLVGGSVWRAIRTGTWSWRRYILQRGTRLWIVLIPALFVGGCLDQIGIWHFGSDGSIYSAPPGQSMVSLGLANRLTLRVLVGNLTFLQTLRVSHYGTNVALWSLANEFWYYVIFPLIALVAIGKQPAGRTTIYPLLAVASLSFVGANVAYLFLVWLLGFLISVLPPIIPEPHRKAGTIVSVLQFMAINALIRTHPTNQVIADTLLGVSFAVFLYFIVNNHRPIQSAAYMRIARNFSNSSYTLYLTHLPFLTFLTAFASTPWRPWPFDPPHIVFAILVVAVTYVYAWGLYLLFERNTDRLRAFIRGVHTPAEMSRT